jgi:hypothetical protein
LAVVGAENHFAAQLAPDPVLAGGLQDHILADWKDFSVSKIASHFVSGPVHTVSLSRRSTVCSPWLVRLGWFAWNDLEAAILADGDRRYLKPCLTSRIKSSG